MCSPHLVLLVLATVFFQTRIAGAGSFCNVTRQYIAATDCKPCIPALMEECPQGSVQITRERCTDTWLPDSTRNTILDHIISTEGRCRHKCRHSVTLSYCCNGYWGPDCQACPPGPDLPDLPFVPCGGHGNCSDGVTGTGQCQCEDGFAGTACEKCEDLKFGSDCSGVCKCQHGYCNAGISGDGSCHCMSGYTGIYCDREIPSCENKECPNGTVCSLDDDNVPQCVCAEGYVQDGSGCIEVDGCAELAKCHEHATCTNTGPGTYSCQCSKDYMGDGTVCQVVDPCQKDYGGCDMESETCIYEKPGQARCECSDGYANETEGQGCDLIDLCTNKSLCHELANCTMIGPLMHHCLCPDGYVGDGLNCYGNILQRMKDMNASDPKFRNQFDKIISLMELTYEDELQNGGPFTFLAYVGSDWNIQPDGDISAAQKLRYAQHFVRGCLIPTVFSLEEFVNVSSKQPLRALDTSSTRKVVTKAAGKYKLQSNDGSRADLLAADLPASNGVIHIFETRVNSFSTLRPPNFDNVLRNQIKWPTGITGGLKQVVLEDLTTVLKEAGNAFTLFLPFGWKQLPDLTAEYLMSPEGRVKLKTILQNHVIPGVRINSLELAGLHEFVSLAGFTNTISVLETGQIAVNQNYTITEYEFPTISTYNMALYTLRDVGIMVPKGLQPIVPQRCDAKTYSIVKGACGPCQGEHHCTDLKDVPVDGSARAGCGFWIGSGRMMRVTGCSILCNRTYTVPKCCPGFYGGDCAQCPGRLNNVCFGRGQCDDGLDGKGACTCKPGLYGAGCEFCEKRNMSGPNCDKPCTCTHGVCDNRVASKGLCKPGSCKEGYVGITCSNRELRCRFRKLVCHEHAQCVDHPLTRFFPDHPLTRFPPGTRRPFLHHWRLLELMKNGQRCECKAGYRGKKGQNCKAVNPCDAQDRGGCHLQAACTNTAPGKRVCKCNEGFVGDGFYCYLGHGCVQNNECHDNARCVMLTPTRRMCVCRTGYHGNGTYCVPNNPCLVNKGGCHKLARCILYGPGNSTCECAKQYGGDGFTCYGDLIYEMRQHPLLTVLSQLLQRIPKADLFLMAFNSNFTFLAPSDEAMQQFLELESSDFWMKEANLMPIVSYHTVPKAFTTNDLKTTYAGKTLQTMAQDDNDLPVSISVAVNKAGNVTFDDDASILEGNIVAVNGFIHIVDQVLEPYPVSWDRPELHQLLASRPEFTHFTQLLQAHGIIDKVEDLEEYTLFIPVNDVMNNTVKAWDTRYFLYYVVPLALPLSRLRNNMPVFSMLGSTSPQYRLHITRKGLDQVFVNDVEITEPNLRTEGGVVHGIATLLHPVLNRCDIEHSAVKLSQCVDCKQLPLPCPRGYTARPSGLGHNYTASCTYTIRGLKLTEKQGCQQQCIRTTTEKECCAGYFGPDCTECPGGADEPCNNHGVCLATIHGSGVCRCDEGYAGNACEDCPAKNCTVDPCEAGACDIHADCQLNRDAPRVTCTCRLGYESDGDGDGCRSKCEDNNGGCSPVAICTVTGEEPEGLSCSCAEEYTGDGLTCTPLTNNSCEWRNGGCSPNAFCKLLPPPDPSFMADTKCVCKPGFTGNGTVCLPDNLPTKPPANQPRVEASKEHKNAHVIGAIVGGSAAGILLIVVVVLVILRCRASADGSPILHKGRFGDFGFGRSRTRGSDAVKFSSAIDVRDAADSGHVDITQFNNPMFRVDPDEDSTADGGKDEL